MTATLTYERAASIGLKVRRLRVSQRITQLELAESAGVSQEEVDRFEHDIPVRLNSKRKILKELWAVKTKK